MSCVACRLRHAEGAHLSEVRRAVVPLFGFKAGRQASLSKSVVAMIGDVSGWRVAGFEPEVAGWGRKGRGSQNRGRATKIEICGGGCGMRRRPVNELPVCAS
jgi:hypothetical protein